MHTHIDKNGNEMAFITLDTMFGHLKVIAFSSSWKKSVKDVVIIGNLLLVRGTRSGNDMFLDSAEILEEKEETA